MTQWFRFYGEALHDPKVQTLPCNLFKTWVNLLCIASQHGGVLPPNTSLNYLLKRRSDHLKRDLNTLVKLELLDRVDGVLKPHNWLVRQYKSDTSTERVRKHRQDKRNVSSAVTETAPETEYRVEVSKKDLCTKKVFRTVYEQRFEDRFWKPYPRTPIMSKAEAYKQWKRLSVEQQETAISAIPGFNAFVKANPTYHAVHACRFLSQGRGDGFKPAAPTGDQARFMLERGWEWRENKWQQKGQHHAAA